MLRGGLGGCLDVLLPDGHVLDHRVGSNESSVDVLSIVVLVDLRARGVHGTISVLLLADHYYLFAFLWLLHRLINMVISHAVL